MHVTNVSTPTMRGGIAERLKSSMVGGRGQGRTNAELEGQFGVATSTSAANCLEWYRTRGRMTSSVMNANLFPTYRSSFKLTTSVIFREASSLFESAPSLQVIHHQLNATSPNENRQTKKPLITVKNWKDRFWSDVPWSSESKTLIFGTDEINVFQSSRVRGVRTKVL